MWNKKDKKFLAIVLIIGIALMFSQLGGRFLWGDEAQNSLFSLNTLRFGIPTFYDGEKLVVDNHLRLEENFWLSDRLTDWNPNQKFDKFDQALKWQAWLPFYISAFFFSVFGTSDFVARLPFAIFGLATLILLYFFVLKWKNDKNLAKISTILLLFFIPFYLYSRQSRYYALSMFLNLLVLFFYIKIINNEKKSWLFFIIINILSFHTFYISFLSTYAAIGLDILIRKNKKLLYSFVKATLIILIFTVPWIFYAQLLTKTGSITISRLIFGFGYQISYILFYILPLLFALYLPFLMIKKTKGKITFDSNYRLIILTILLGLIANAFGPWDLPAFRYTVFLFPLFMILNAAVIQKLLKWKFWLGILTLILIISSNLLLVFPMKFAEPLVLTNLQGQEARSFIIDNLRISYPLISYVQEISKPFDNPNKAIITYLKKNGKDTDSFLTNVDYTTFIWYLKMKPILSEDTSIPTWIIPRKPYNLWGSQIATEDYQFVLSKLENAEYEKITIDSTDYIYPLDTPHPRVHRYITNTELTTNNQYPYETYPIEIYRLK